MLQSDEMSSAWRRATLRGGTDRRRPGGRRLRPGRIIRRCRGPMRSMVYIALLLAADILHGQTVAEGVAALDAARFDAEARILAAVVEREPGSAEANFYLGLAHFRA